MLQPKPESNTACQIYLRVAVKFTGEYSFGNMSARSTRRTNREQQPVTMVTTHAEVHTVEEDEIGPATPVQSPVRPAKKAAKKATKGKGKAKAPATKRVTVSELSETVIAMQQSADRQEGRVERVEGRMDGMDAKLDFIVSALGKDNATVHNNTVTPCSEAQTPRGSGTQREGRQPAVQQVTRDTAPVTPAPPVLAPLCPLPPPAALVAEQNKEGALDAVMSRQNFKQSENSGKTVSYGESGMPKPYMFLEREGLQTNRQKLDLRCSMTSDEYMYCALALLHEKDSCQPEDRDHILEHVFAVATDILTRPWPAVRRWTNYVWDSVEKGRCKWDDFRFIQDARVRLSYMTGPAPIGGGSSIGTRGGPSAPGTECKSVVCPDFNSPHGCAFSSSHDDGKIRYTHACAHCNALGRRSAHSFQRCRTRLDAQAYNGASNAHMQASADTRQWNQPLPRQQAAQAQPFNYGNRNGNAYGHGQAKNGY